MMVSDAEFPALSVAVTVNRLGPSFRSTVNNQLDNVPSLGPPVLMVTESSSEAGSGSKAIPSRTIWVSSVEKSFPSLVVISTVGAVESTSTRKDQPPQIPQSCPGAISSKSHHLIVLTGDHVSRQPYCWDGTSRYPTTVTK